MNNTNLEIRIHSVRYYGQPKLAKPRSLTGIKQIGSAKWLRHCSCPVFILGTQIWIKHRDWFSDDFVPPSSDDRSKSQDYLLRKYFNQSKRQKFIYSDNWGSIVLRNEAWVILHQGAIYDKLPIPDDGLIHSFPIDASNAIANFIGIDQFELSLDWRRFFEEVDELRTIALHRLSEVNAE